MSDASEIVDYSSFFFFFFYLIYAHIAGITDSLSVYTLTRTLESHCTDLFAPKKSVNNFVCSSLVTLCLNSVNLEITEYLSKNAVVDALLLVSLARNIKHRINY